MPRSRDDDDDDDKPARKPRPSVLPKVLAGVGVIPWAVLALAVAVLVLGFFAAMGKAETAFQECSISASTAALLIACYALARCAEKVLAAVGKLVAKDG